METATINQYAKRPDRLFTAFRLRQLLKEGRLPGFYAGSRYYLRVDLLPALLDELTSATSATVQAAPQ